MGTDPPDARRPDPLQEHYALGGERARLADGLGQVEFERTKEILARHLPPPPATIADVGGGPGRYARWLAGRGYTVRLRDLVALHVQQALEDAGADGLGLDAAVGDARDLDLPAGSADAVLLLGPLYHLTEPSDRAQCLAEVKRVLRPGGITFVAAISRWAPRLHAEVAATFYRQFDNLREWVLGTEATGIMRLLYEGSFTGYCHRPNELRAEIEAAGLECLDLVSVEGVAYMLPDLDQRLANDLDREVVFDAARVLERVPELMGVGPHLLATARKGA